MKRTVIIANPNNYAKIQRVMTNIQKLYEHMNKTLLVMLDRSMWFHPSYEALIANKMDALITYDPKLKGKEESIIEPLTYAFAYAQKVFLCTAIELFFLHHYMNSVYLHEQTCKRSIDNLSTLRRWVESRRNISSWDDWKSMAFDQKTKIMSEISFSNLQTAQDFFADIYGKDCFKQALSENGFKKFMKDFEKIQGERNGILHRGGLFKDWSSIKVTKSDIQETYETAKFIRDKLQDISSWTFHWWANNIGHFF